MKTITKTFEDKPIVSQKFCATCGGMLKLKVGNSIIKPKDWMKYGMACDIGCICI